MWVNGWVKDWYGDYTSEPQYNPSGPESGADRVYRGGSWIAVAHYCRLAVRNRGDPANRDYYLGFRLARRV